jgi:plasmid replication initiation protein
MSSIDGSTNGDDMSTKKSQSVARTTREEISLQQVFDFFTQGIPITEAPKDIVFKKSNAAIKMISTLNLLELKIIDACVFIAKPKMVENVLHSADIDYFKWLISFNSNNREHIKRAITKIQQTLIQINIVDEQNPDDDFWYSTPFLYDITITNGRVSFRIPESIRQPLANPKSWTYLSFRIKNLFTSEYAYRLYERCRAEQFRGATDWWELPEFRKMMNVVDLYGEFQDLQKRVIRPAVDQINTHSDIFITPDFLARGRTKTHIRFIVEENPNVVKSEDTKEMLPIELYDTLKKEFGFSNTQIDEVSKYPIDYLAEKIEFTRYRINTSKNPVGRPDLYLLKALKEDLQFNTNEKEKIESVKKSQETQQAEMIREQGLRAISSKKSQLLDEYYALDEAARNQIWDDFKASPYYESAAKTFRGRKFNPDSPIVKDQLSSFLLERATVTSQ